MRGWVLPAAAGALWAGILAAGTDLPRGAGALLCVAGLVLVGVAVALAPRPGDGRLLARAGLIQLSARDRVLAAAGFLHPPRPPGAGWPGLRVPAVLLGFAVLGAGWSAARRPPSDALAPLAGRSLRFEGTASSDPRIGDFGWSADARVAGRALGSGVPLPELHVWLEGHDRPPPLEPGRAISGRGTLRVVRAGPAGFSDYLSSRGIAALITVHALDIRGPPRSTALRAANAVRSALRRGAQATLRPREAGLFLGLAVGDVATMDPEVEEDFRATGLGHLVAVSGSNVAMFLAPILGLVGLLGGGARARVVAGVAAVVFFALLTRWEPSVLRASVMATVALLGVLAGSPRSTATVLGGAILFLLVADPGLAGSLGFQLSVAATAGITALTGPLARRLRWLPRPIALVVAATLGAQLGVAPLLLAAFGTVPVVTVLTNLLAAPLVPAALLGGLSAAGAGLAWPAAGRLLGELAAVPLVLLEGVADRTAKLGLPSVVGDGMVLPLVAAVGALVAAWRLRRGRRRVATAFLLPVLALLAWGGGVSAGPPGSLTVTFFDVGQGDAALVRTPEGATVLFDAGPDPELVATKLAAGGVGVIDLAIATHAHADHVEGFPAVLARHTVGLLLEPGCACDSPSYRRFRRAVTAERVPVRVARGGKRLALGALVVDVLGPDRCGLGEGPNDDSVVIRLSYRGATILFSGDAERPAQRDLLADGDPVRAEVLKVAHHGGDTSEAAFVRRVGARLAVVSVGENTYGHPVPAALAALRAAGAGVWRTDRSGDITVAFTAAGIVVRSTR